MEIERIRSSKTVDKPRRLCPGQDVERVVLDSHKCLCRVAGMPMDGIVLLTVVEINGEARDCAGLKLNGKGPLRMGMTIPMPIHHLRWNTPPSASEWRWSTDDEKAEN